LKEPEALMVHFVGQVRSASPQLTLTQQWATVRRKIGRERMSMSIQRSAISVAFVGVLFLVGADAQAQTSPQGGWIAAQTVPEDFVARSVRRPPRRVPIYPRYQAEPDEVYPRYYPGPDAVRVCNATYAQEYRPSGPVIVPHMTCVWRRG